MASRTLKTTFMAVRGVRIWSWLLLGLLFVALSAVLTEWLRGSWALRQWKREMVAQGEILAPSQLWPGASSRSREFSSQLSQAIKRLPDGMQEYAGRVSSIVAVGSARCLRGSQEPRPVLEYQVKGAKAREDSHSWQDLNAVVQQAQPALQSLRRLMIDPPAGIGYDIIETLEANSIPNFVNVRRAAQALHIAAMNDLHRGDLAGALENLKALSGFARLYVDDPNLVNYLIRVAIIGLNLGVSWDALQANGWTEPQLAILQQADQDQEMLTRLPRTFEAIRAERLFAFNWFRWHSCGSWLDRNLPLCEAFGAQSAVVQRSDYLQGWDQTVFHAVWSFAWADQEELDYLHYAQADLASLRRAAKKGSWRQLNEELALNCRNYRPPPAGWRFYGRLPLFDQLPMIVSGSSITPGVCPYPNFGTAWFTSLKTLTLHQMLVTAIAIRRYEMRYGRLPPTLVALVPEFLPITPRDFMDGRPLRYRLNAANSFVLYSVGENTHDDGGDARPGRATENTRDPSPWNGRDWVWPTEVRGNDGVDTNVPVHLAEERRLKKRSSERN